MLRPRAETMPAVTEPPRPNGLPIATTQSPGRILSDSPNFTCLRGLSGFTRRTARSIFESLPTISALRREPPEKMTLMSFASPMTWLLVTTMPDGSMTKPEPSEFERRWRGLSPPCPPGPPWPPWPRRLKNSSNRSSNGVPGGSCGSARPRASTVVEAEMLTTAGMISSARSAKDSGAARAQASTGRSVAARANTPTTAAARRPPEGAAGAARTFTRAMAFPRFGAMPRIGSLRLHSSAIAAKARLAASRPELAHRPHDHNSEHGGSDSDETHAVARRVRGFDHGASDPIRKGREQKPLDRKSEPEGGGEVAHAARLLGRSGRGGARRARAGRRRDGGARAAHRRRRRRGARAAEAAPAARVIEIAEELRGRAQHHARVRVAQAGLIGLHRPEEGEEIGILAEGVGEDAILVGVALAPGLLRLAGRLGDDDGRLALRPGPDGRRLLLAVGAQIRGFALSLGLHALIHRLAVRGRQVDARQSQVDDLDAEVLRLPVHVLLDAVHQVAALGAHDRVARGVGENVAHRGVDEAAEPLVCDRNRADGLEELQRVRDPVAREGVDLEVLPVGREDGLDRQVEIEDALLERHHVLDERPFKIEAGRVLAGLVRDRADAAELQHQGLLRLADDEGRGIEQDRREPEEHDDAGADDAAHRVAPWPCAGAAGGRRCISVSGRYGTTPEPWPLWSMMILSMPPSTRSMVSRKMRSRMTAGALRYSS